LYVSKEQELSSKFNEKVETLKMKEKLEVSLREMVEQK